MPDPTIHPILVTGASSGIGRHLAGYLAERGHPVYATARKAEDLAVLAQIANITPFQMDVRDPNQIQAVEEIISQTGNGLYGLVNNAGVGGLGLLTTWTDAEMQNIFDVNVFGPHRMTNAFIHHLLKARGRIINIGSQGGMISSKYFGPYTMTKHALEAYTETLYQELRPYGVFVSIIQPGGIITDIGENSMAETLTHFKRAEPPFDIEAREVLASFQQPQVGPDKDEPESENNRKPSPPDIVTAAVYEALFSAQPKLHYLVGTQWEGDRVINGLLAKLLDENDNPQHHYSREYLISLLDQLIERRNQA